MNIVILGGFLGSGKTTVLMQFARYLVSKSDPFGIPVVILENEISENGVDNQLLSRADFTVENIFSGCICCTGTIQLCTAIEQIWEKYRPEWLLIEATGLAYPDDIRKAIMDELRMPANVLAIVDAKRWKRVVVALEQFVTSQLFGAAVVLLTKVDLVDSQTEEAVMASVWNYAKNASAYSVCAIEPQGDNFWEVVANRLKES